MHRDEFAWYPIAPRFIAGNNSGAQLRRGGPSGEIYAAVTKLEGEPWLAIVNLHRPTPQVRSEACDSELDAIQAVEVWLDAFLGDE